MHNWKLTAGDPLALTLATDARLADPDFSNDHIWEVDLSGGEPSAVSIHTTFGLRALSMRLFPRYYQGSSIVTDPASFAQPPVVREFYPNFLLLSYSPFPGLDVKCEYYVPESQKLVGRLRLNNSNIIPMQVKVDWIAILSPMGEGQGMTPAQIDVTNILQGKSNGLSPVLIMTGVPSAEASPYPSLVINRELMPGNTLELSWCLATYSDPLTSFDAARKVINRPWEPELTRLEMLNHQYLLDIETGDPAWNAAFAFSQKTAYSLIFNATSHLPHSSFVLSRQPDQGFSPRGDGSDYDHTWDGQSPLDSYYLANLLLPGGSHLVQGLLYNFLSTQVDDNTIDHRPGLAGHLAHFSALPILSSLTWQVFQYSQDATFLSDLFPGLLRFVESWFTTLHDRDQDGFPEWDYVQQAFFEENPAFDFWHSWGQGYEITTFENPGLGALLYKELHNLIQIAKFLNQPEDVIQHLFRKAAFLKTAVEACWDPRRSIYRNRDRDTHLSLNGEILEQLFGSGDTKINVVFDSPQRLHVTVLLDCDATCPAVITIHGKTSSGLNEEVITARSLVWVQGKGCFTSQELYLEVDRINITGVGEKDEIILSSVGYAQCDCSHLLPLWAGIPNKRRAAAIIKNNILSKERFFLPYGLPLCLKPSKDIDTTPSETLDLICNLFVVEGLLEYQNVAEAVQLFSRWMSAIIPALRVHHAFYSQYNAHTGSGFGVRNSLSGLAPLGLFLNILGIRILSPDRLVVTRYNPFPWPVRINFRGLSVVRETRQTHITFPGGQSVTINGPATQIVSLA